MSRIESYISIPKQNTYEKKSRIIITRILHEWGT